VVNKDFSNTPKWVKAKDIKNGDFIQVSFPTHNNNETEILVSDYIRLKGIDIVDGKIFIRRSPCGYEYYAEFI